MRDYVVIALVLATLPVGLVSPFYGLLAYTWISYMYPQELAWSFAQTFPVAKLSAASVIAGLTFKLPGNLPAISQRENLAMLFLWATFTVSTVFAFHPDAAWLKWQQASKLIIMSLAASLLLRDRQCIRLFLLVIAFSIGFYGAKGGVFGIMTGGTQMVLGPGNSIIGANNAIGLALNMCLPVCWYLAREERGWIKRALQAVFFLSIPATMFTYSRGSALTLAVILLAIVLRSKHRIILVAAMLTVSAFALPLLSQILPQKWVDRQQTVLTYEEDSSAMSRLDNWKFCWRVATDNPITGAGFDFQSREVFARYYPEFLLKYGGKVWDTHNIFLGILTSHGFPGLIAFVLMIVFCLRSCSQLKRATRNNPNMHWVYTYSEMIQLSFLAFLLNGMFANMEYYDLPYHWIAVVATLKVVVSRETAQTHAERFGVPSEQLPTIDLARA